MCVASRSVHLPLWPPLSNSLGFTEPYARLTQFFVDTPARQAVAIRHVHKALMVKRDTSRLIILRMVDSFTPARCTAVDQVIQAAASARADELRMSVVARRAASFCRRAATATSWSRNAASRQKRIQT